MSIEWRHILEIGNGLWTIVAAYLVVFLAYHLVVVGAQRRILRRGLMNVPLSIQLTVGMWVSIIGVLMTRAVIWVGRSKNDGYLDLHSTETLTFAVGVLIGLIGFLCVLRVATRPMLGRWPWISCLGCCAFYIIMYVLDRA